MSVGKNSAQNVANRKNLVLGIDPGFIVTGYSIMDSQGVKISLMDHGVLRLPSQRSLSHRIHQFYLFFHAILSRLPITTIALETPFFHKNVQVFLKLGYLRGVIYLLADMFHVPVIEFAPREIKMHVAGFGGADKEQVSRAIVRFFPSLQISQYYDEADAVAIALCGIFRSHVR